MSEKKPARTLELHVDVDAPLEAAWEALTTGPGIANWFAPVAEVSAPGLGATVKSGWSPEMMMESKVDAWEPLARVRWYDDSGWMGEGTALAIEWQLSTENGKTRVRLVQSAFGESEGWADLFDGTEIGWTYFLYNLRELLERHRGRTRVMISERLPSPVPRARMWKRLVDKGLGKVSVGDRVHVMLGGKATPGVVEMVVPERALALRMPGLGNALLFAELEGKGDKFSIGYWLSLYDAAIARRVEKRAKQAFRALHAGG